MTTTRKQLRSVALGVALALTLAVAGSAVAEPAAWGGGWMTDGLEQLERWWSEMWEGEAGTVRAASETGPQRGPEDGTTAVGDEPDGSSLLLGDGETGETEAAPRLDPNG